MRPQVAGSPSSGSPGRRKQSITAPGLSSASTAPSTFFMASESMLDSNQTPTASMSDTAFGVKSLSEEMPQHETRHEREDGRRRSTIIASRTLIRDMSKDSLSMGSFASSSSDSSSPSRQPAQQIRTNTNDTAQTRLPLSFQSPILGTSEPGSPKSMSMSSFRPSDDELLDDQSSQAVMSDSEDEQLPTAGLGDSTHAPQFIMPSIMMPSRRPFSNKGRDMGRLKILLAGSSGCGKTSLIKSIVQTCEDIVHIDASLPVNTHAKKSRRHAHAYNKTKQITETYASTKAYTSWWSEIEQSNVLRRRRQSGDGTVLERNICFIDTPGYDSGTSILEGMDKVLKYIEAQANTSLDAANLDEAEALHLLGGGGGSQVDVVLYLLSHPIKPADLEFMKQLSSIANVVPLLAKADTLPTEHLDQIRMSLSEELAAAEIRTFQLSLQSPLHYLYTVCSSPSKDLENMDASLLMQSNYVQPLHASDLPSLISHLFDPETNRKLKYFAAKTVLQIRNTPRASTMAPSPRKTTIMPGFNRASTAPSPSDFFRASSQELVSRLPGTMTYTQSAVTDHTLREERLARVHLANWASNLQRSLANERAKYEAIAKAERSEWLKARLGECVFEQNLDTSVPEEKHQLALACRTKARSPRQLPAEKRSSYAFPQVSKHDPADPLGLLRLRDELGAHGALFLKVMGGAGLVGAVGTFLFFSIKSWTDGGSFHVGQPSFFGDW